MRWGDPRPPGKAGEVATVTGKTRGRAGQGRSELQSRPGTSDLGSLSECALNTGGTGQTWGAQRAAPAGPAPVSSQGGAPGPCRDRLCSGDHAPGPHSGADTQVGKGGGEAGMGTAATRAWAISGSPPSVAKLRGVLTSWLLPITPLSTPGRLAQEDRLSSSPTAQTAPLTRGLASPAAGPGQNPRRLTS